MNDEQFNEHVVTSVAVMPEFARFMTEHHPEMIDYIARRYGKDASRAWDSMHGYSHGGCLQVGSKIQP